MSSAFKLVRKLSVSKAVWQPAANLANNVATSCKKKSDE